jgi:4-hydroxybenzoate polyprenyltransferase
VVLLFLSFAYSYRFKGSVLVGNLIVGTVCCGTLLFGSSAFGRMPASAWVAAMIILLFVVAYEIVKTLQDRVADGAAGLRTLATRYASRVSVAAYTGAVTMLCACALGVGPAVSSKPLSYLGFLVPCLIVPVCSCAHILVSWPDRDRSAARALLIMRFAWFPGLLSLTLLK